ncbi:MAG: hypothetical protein J0H06_10875 [Actinobacteria bacterium]|nr:hypothetical protein [Actinomycetota bacterium]
MGSAARGNAAEAAVLHGLVGRGLDVFVPFGSGHPFDLAVHVPEAGFLRVQCKRAWPVGACVVFNSHSTDHGSGPKSYIASPPTLRSRSGRRRNSGRSARRLAGWIWR